MAMKQQLSDAQKDSIVALGDLNQSVVAAQGRVADQQIPDDAVETQRQITQGIVDAKASINAILPAPAVPASPPDAPAAPPQ